MLLRLFTPVLFALSVCSRSHAVLDSAGDGLADVWQSYYDAARVDPSADDDGDGLSNRDESLLGTDPFDTRSRLSADLSAPGGRWRVAWSAQPGKRYEAEFSPDLSPDSWTSFSIAEGFSGEVGVPLDFADAAPPRFFVRVRGEDLDTDGDGVGDWDELRLGFNPRRVYTEGLGNYSTISPVTDYHRIRDILAAPTSRLTIAAVDPAMEENWPDPGLVVVRRAGWWSKSEVSRLDPLTVNISLSGTATADADYDAPASLAVHFEFGKDEAVLRLIPLPDDEREEEETVTVTLLPGDGYTLGAQTTATLRIADGHGGAPGPKEAVRFLAQAGFGATDAEIGRVRELGIAGWLERQAALPPTLHRPLLQEWSDELLAGGASNPNPASEYRMETWWRLAMRDDADADHLRQRVGYALSQIFVISDKLATINADERGVADYNDTLNAHALGNYRDLLGAITRHPMMGLYLGSLRNRKADPALNRYPDENFAREILQLFSIGLWRLHPDGGPVRSDGTDLGPDGAVVPAGEPIPSYGQTQIAVMARIMTGLSYSMRTVSDRILLEVPVTKFNDSYNIGWHPMRMFDAEHDLDPKTLWFPGREPLDLPARDPGLALLDLGLAGDADIDAALDYIFEHPNVGPFVSRLLIQRLVTSNPRPDYIARVSAVFADDGRGERGNLGAVVRAILLDEEARDFARTLDPEHGLVREPYLRYVALARALGASPGHASAEGRYRGFDGIGDEFGQRPLSSPSVFNFYSPDYRPQGDLRDAGLAAPELQITNSITAIAGPNRISQALDPNGADAFTGFDGTQGLTQFNRSKINDDGATSVDERRWNTRADEAPWVEVAAGDPDALVARLDRLLCAGRMTPASLRAVARSIRRLEDPASATDPLLRTRRALMRFRLAALLVTTSADHAVLP